VAAKLAYRCRCWRRRGLHAFDADKDTAEAVALGVRKEGQPGMKDA
jgi:hypothetical protein